MSDEIIIAIITLCGALVSAFATARISANKFSYELERKISVIETKLDNYGKDIQQHNHYAQLFAESMPVVKEQIKVINHRIDDLERSK